MKDTYKAYVEIEVPGAWVWVGEEVPQFGLGQDYVTLSLFKFFFYNYIVLPWLDKKKKQNQKPISINSCVHLDKMLAIN